MAKDSLSKSTYIKGLQCLKYLYLYKKHYNLKDRLSSQKLSTFRRGTNVGILARRIFKGGIDLSPKNNFKFEEALIRTKHHVHNDFPVLYEASFKYNETIVFLDILVKEENGWHCYEVKSSLEISETYLHDASLQYFVINGTGLKINDFSLITVNENYVRNKEIDVHKLFKITSVYKSVIELQDSVLQNIIKQKDILAKEAIPEIDIGMHCYHPYECEYIGFCWNKIKNNSLFNTDILTLDEKLLLYKQGRHDINNIQEIIPLDNKRLIKLSCQFSKTEYINKEGLKDIIDGVSQNLCFLDVQFFKPAIPLFEKNKPYEYFPYMLTISEAELKTEKPHFFLCSSESDGRKKLIEFMIEWTRTYNTIIVYDIIPIKEALQDLIQENDYCRTEYSKFLAKIITLKDIFYQNLYYSYKIRDLEFYALLVSLNLKNPYPHKERINNSFEAHDAFLNFVGHDDLVNQGTIKERLHNFGLSNTSYLTSLWKFIQKKTAASFNQ